MLFPSAVSLEGLLKLLIVDAIYCKIAANNK